VSPYRRGSTYWGRLSTRDGARHRLSLRTTDKESAERLERMLDTLADQHRWIALDALRTGALTLAECWDAFARNRVAELERSIADGSRSRDLEPFVQQWAEAMARKKRPSVGVQAKYVMQVRRLIPGGKAFPSDRFTTPALSAWLHALPIGQPNRYQAALSRFAKFLVERGILQDNPLSHVERASESEPKVVHLSREEVVRVLGALSPRDRPIHALMACTGVEWQAATSARASDLDVSARTFRAHGTKTAARERLVALSEGPALEILRDYVKGARLLPSAPLFPRYAHSAALKRLKAACAAVGVRIITIHDWRHVYAVQAVRDRVPYYLIANQLGHTNTVMVQRVYGRFTPDLRDLGVQHADTAPQNTPADTPAIHAKG